MESLKFLDLFAGVGGFRLGMEKAGHRCLGFCEIDKFARTSYKAIHDTTKEVEKHDITAITDEFIRGIGVGEVDVICGGFPCQAFSIAGNRGGFDDARGTLFFEIARFASILKPKLLFLENVTGLLNHEGGATFETIIRALDEIGYDCEWDCINSKHYVPQNRDRVFIIGHLRGERTRKVFPFARESSSTIVKKINQKLAVPVLTPERYEKRQNGRRFKNNQDVMFTLTAQDRHRVMVAGNLQGNHDQNNRVYDPTGIAPTLTTMQGGGQEPKIICSTDFRIRKLTPRECWRLQGFPDWAFEKAATVNSNSQLYKQAGNSVTVPVIYEIAKRLEVYA